mgnify:CR=1 FL=1
MTNPILVQAFRALSPEQRARLRWHAEQKTPICCGELAYIYTNGHGGG